MKNLNPIYLFEWSDYTIDDYTRGVLGGAVGTGAGAIISKALLKNVSDIKEFISNTESPEECIKGLIGYADGVTPIALIASRCISKCRKYPENYKQRCLKLLNNYLALGTTAGTLGGAVAGYSGGYLSRSMF